jgi:hypothetical protein
MAKPSGSGTSQSGTTGTATTIKPDAIRFCTDLLTDQTLAKAYYNEIATASKNKTYEEEIIDNWLTAQKYNCGIEDVLLAQKQLPTYQLYYWSGGYKTLLGSNKAAGPVFTVHAYDSGAQQIGYGTMFIISPQFSNLVLSWDTQGGLNQNSGSLTFTLSAPSSGVATRSFYGTITDSSGTAQPIAGALMTTAQLSTAAQNGQAPPAQNMSALQIATTVVNFVAQTTFITLNFVMLYKTGKEITQLKEQLAKKPDNPELKKQQADAEKQQSESESSQEDALNSGEDIQGEFSDLSESDISDTMSEVVGGNEQVPLDLPSDVEAPTGEQQDLLNSAVEEDSEESSTEPDEEGEDVDDIFDDIDEIPDL